MPLIRVIWKFDSSHSDLSYQDCLSWYYRGVAQLVARLLWEQDVAGSSPVTPTMPT